MPGAAERFARGAGVHVEWRPEETTLLPAEADGR
jgi:hypothetical protein